MKNPVLQIENLTVGINRKTILHRISLTVRQEEIVIVLGSNGSGKTSLLKAVNGLLPVDSGKILLHNQDYTGKSVSERSRSIVTIGQDPDLSTFSELTIRENYRIGKDRQRRFPSFHNISEDVLREHLFPFNPRLVDRLDTPVKTLSGGERQALGLAVALQGNPALLLLDEHTSALDPHASDAIMELTESKIRNKKLTAIMITHNLDHAAKYGDRVIIMQQGRIVFDVSGTEKRRLSSEDLYRMYTDLQKTPILDPKKGLVGA